MIFVSAIISSVLFLIASQFSRNKFTVAKIQKFAYYQWAGAEVVAEIQRE